MADQPVESRRMIFFVSDSTAITAETLGHSLLSQFEHMQFDQTTLPFIDTPKKALDAFNLINDEVKKSPFRPIVFSTLIKPEIRQIIKSSGCILIDFFESFIDQLEAELKMEPSHKVGRYRGLLSDTNYDVRIDAVNYALGNDDGISTKEYDQADIILIGVSRTGKTPTCLYLGLQFGIYAANYPLTEEDLVGKYTCLPAFLAPFRRKLYGLTITPERLQKLRSERRPGSRYASLRQCQIELSMSEFLFVYEEIPYLNVTTMSVEEIAATILHMSKLHRRLY